MTGRRLEGKSVFRDNSVFTPNVTLTKYSRYIIMQIHIHVIKNAMSRTHYVKTEMTAEFASGRTKITVFLDYLSQNLLTMMFNKKQQNNMIYE